MKEYILELLKNNMWVFPIKGRGATVDEAKRPMSFALKDEVITWKDERILSYSEELAKKGHEAWGLWLLKSERFGIDIDVYKSQLENREDVKNRIINALKNLNEVYMEVSGQGGIHLIASTPFRVENEVYRLVVRPERYKWVEFKHDGYFIIYPTVLRTPERELKYEKISGDLLNAEDIEIIYPTIERVLSEALGDDELNLTLEVTKSVKGGGRYRAVGVRIGEISGLDLDSLTDNQVNALLYLLFMEAGCEGMAKALEWIDEHRIVPIRKRFYDVMRIPRTTRFLFQHTLAGVMAYLGFSDARIRDWMLSWKFIDENEDPRGDSLSNALYNVFNYGALDLTPRGACPWCWVFLKKESCGLTPFSSVSRLSKERILKVVEFVKRNVKE